MTFTACYKAADESNSGLLSTSAKIGSGAVQGSITEFTKAIKLDSTSARVYAGRGALKYAMGDNKAAIAWSSNSALSQKMRHVERNLLYVRQEVLKKTFQLVWVETANQVADLFTKALSPIVFWRFVNMLMISGSRYREEYDSVEEEN